MNLVEDKFFVDVLNKSQLDDEDVVVYADGIWHPSSATRDKKKKRGVEEADKDDEIVLDDEKVDEDDDDDDIRVTKVTKKSTVIDLTDDSFHEDDGDIVIL